MNLRPLREFLLDSRDDLELRQLVADLVGTAHKLPGPGAPLAVVVQAALGVLKRAGAIDDALHHLEASLPRRAREIERLRTEVFSRASVRPTPRGVEVDQDHSPHIPGPEATIAARAERLIQLIEQQGALGPLNEAVASARSHTSKDVRAGLIGLSVRRTHGAPRSDPTPTRGQRAVIRPSPLHDVNLARLTVAGCREYDVDGLLAELTGLSASELESRLNSANSTMLLPAALGDAWPTLAAFGRHSVSSALTRGLAGTISGLTGLTTSSVLRRLRAANRRVHVATLFADTWPKVSVFAASETEVGDEASSPRRRHSSTPSPATRAPSSRSSSRHRLHALDLAFVTVKQSRGLELGEPLVEIMGLSELAVQRRLANAHGRLRLSSLFDDSWPAYDELGRRSVASALELGLAGTIAGAIERDASVVLRQLSRASRRVFVSTALADIWPADEEPDEESRAGSEPDDVEDELHLYDLASMTVSQSRYFDAEDVLAELTELSTRTIRRRIRQAHGRTQLQNVFGDAWPSAEELGRRSVAKALSLGLAGTIAEVVDGRAAAILRRLASARRRAHVSTVFADVWPEELDEALRDVEDETSGWVEAPNHALDLATVTVKQSRQLDVVDALAEITELSARAVRRRLGRAHGRVQLRNLFDAEWPLPEALGRYSVATVREFGLAGTIAGVLDRHVSKVIQELMRASGRAHVATVFAEVWPAEEGDEDDEDEGDEEDYEASPPDDSTHPLHPVDLSSLSISQARDYALEEVLVALTGLDEAAISECLEHTHGRTKLARAFTSHWPSHGDLGLYNAAKALSLGLGGTLAGLTGLSIEAVLDALHESNPRTHVATIFADEWPESELVDEVEILRDPIQLLDLARLSVAQSECYELEELLVELCDIPKRSLRSRLKRVHGRTLLINALEDAWPSPEAISLLTVERALSLRLAGTIAALSGIAARSSLQRLREADRRTRVAALFTGHWSIT